MTSPRGDSPKELLVLEIVLAIVPTIRFAIGAMATAYLLMIAVSAGSLATVLVTMTLLMLIDVGWWVPLSTFMSMSVTRRPNDDALLTGMFRAAAFGSMQL